MCNQLGFPGKAQAVVRAQFGQGAGLPILLENVNCSGTENFIDNCQLGSWGNTSCEHSQDAGVVCTREWGVALCVSGACMCVRVCVRTSTYIQYVSWLSSYSWYMYMQLCAYVRRYMCSLTH